MLVASLLLLQMMVAQKTFWTLQKLSASFFNFRDAIHFAFFIAAGLLELKVLSYSNIGLGSTEGMCLPLKDAARGLNHQQLGFLPNKKVSDFFRSVL